MKRSFLAILLCAALLIPVTASATHLGAGNLPRDYIPAPAGCLALMQYYIHLSADTLNSDGNSVATDVDFSGDVGLFRPVYWMEVGPFVMDPQFILPFGALNLESTSLGLDTTASGVGDPILLATIWFINNKESKTWLGFTPFFFIPIGDDDNRGGLSVGAEDRWRFREELGFVQGFEVIPSHNAYFELQVGVDLFADGDDVAPAPINTTLSQDPIFNLESHLSYDLTKDIFISADYYGHWGGEQEVDGFTVVNSETATQTIGFTLAYSLSPSYQLLFQYKSDIDVDNGLEQQAIVFRFLYACDVGYLFGKTAAGK